MAANDQYDLLLNGKGYMLVRARSGAARAWKRTGVNVTPAGQSPDEGRFNAGPAEIRFAETFDDFSGGFGYAYRTAAPPNGIHWSENMDTRFPGQAVHCQALLMASTIDPNTLLSGGINPLIGGLQWLTDVPLVAANPPEGFGGVLAHGRGGGANAWLLYPRTDVFPPAVQATMVNDGSANPQRMGPAAIFGSFVYLGSATGNFIRTDLDGRNGTLGPIPARGFVTAGNRLWAAVGPVDTPNALQSVAAGALGMTTGDYSATLPVGNGLRPIKDLAAIGVNPSGAQVFCGLSDGLYAGDQGGQFVNVTGDLAGQSNVDNFRDLCVHNGQVVGQSVGGVVSYDPTSTAQARTRFLGPVQRSNKSPVRGYPRAVTSFGGWLYAGLWTGSSGYVIAGQDQQGAGPYQWHVLNKIPAPAKPARLHVDGITYGSGSNPATPVTNRFWVATESTWSGAIVLGGSLAPLYFQPIPRMGGNPLAADVGFSANYNGSARMVLPRSDRGAPGVLKLYEYAEVWADAFLSGSRYADVYYAIDGGARTLLGRAQTSPVSRLYFTQSNPSYYSGRSIEYDVESYDATPGTCQVYRSIVGYGVMRPVVSGVIEAVVHVGDNVPDRRGTPMRPGRVMSAELHALEDPNQSGGQICTLVDLAGATQTVAVIPPVGESEIYQDGSKDPELAFSLRMAVLTYSGS